MECDVLINHRSRTAREQAAGVVRALEESGFVIKKTHAITRANSLPDALTAAVRRRPKLLIIGGGDGTVSSAMGRLAGTQIEVGIVPLGTTNNFARSLNIPLDIEDAVRIILVCKAHPVDLGVVNGLYFANVASLGISAEIARHVTDATKRRWGRMAYAVVGMKQLMIHRPFTVTIEDIRRNLTITLETHQIIIANGRYHAGRQIAEDTAIDDGQLLIFALGGVSRFSFIKHMVDFYIGRRRQIAHASYFIGRHVKLSTVDERHIEVDGEVRKRTPVIATVKTAKVAVRFKK